MTSGIQTGKKDLIVRIYKHRWNYIFALPMVAALFIFCYIPMYGVTLAFKDYSIKSGIIGSTWVGLQYYQQLLDSIMFKRTVTNTLILSGLRILFGFPAPILFALLVNEIGNIKYKKITQTISYLPHFVSWVVIAGIITELLSPTRGTLNYFRTLFNLVPINYLATPNAFRPIYVISGIWKDVGWGSIIYLAAISSIDQEQYESAALDGANRVQCILHITLPSISSVISIQLILSMGGVLNGGFDQVFNLYNPMVYETADIIDTYAYRIGLEGKMQYSLSTAINLFKNIIGFSLVVVTNVITKRVSGGDNYIW